MMGAPNTNDDYFLSLVFACLDGIGFCLDGDEIIFLIFAFNIIHLD